MPKSNRIEACIFPAFSVNGSEIGANYGAFTINGEILKIVVENPTSPGSIFIQESGTNITLFKQNNITSGTAAFVYYPFVYGVNNVAAAGSAIAITQIVIADLMFIGSGFTSGTGTTFGPVTIYFR